MPAKDGQYPPPGAEPKGVDSKIAMNGGLLEGIPDVAVLAGGLATRMGPITAKIPKSLIDVNGRPFISYQLELLKNSGVSNVAFCVGHFGEQIRDAFPDGKPWGLKLFYSFDGNKLLGTGGALKQALPLLSDPFFVLYGDSFLPIGLQPLIQGLPPDKDGLMTVFCNDGQWDRSNVRFENGEIIEYDKKKPGTQMKHIDYGLSLLRKSVLKDVREDTFDLSDLFSSLVSKKRMAAIEVKSRFYEIGSLNGLEEFRQFVSKSKNCTSTI